MGYRKLAILAACFAATSLRAHATPNMSTEGAIETAVLSTELNETYKQCLSSGNSTLTCCVEGMTVYCSPWPYAGDPRYDACTKFFNKCATDW